MTETREWTNELVDEHVGTLCANAEKALEAFLDFDQVGS